MALKTGPAPIAKRRLRPMLVFELGGRPHAAPVEELGGVWPWEGAVAVPSSTPYVAGVLRRGERSDEILPIFDLARRLGVRVQGDRGLCLMVKHPTGLVAVQIDATVPTLELVAPEHLTASDGAEPAMIGTFTSGDRRIEIYSLVGLMGRGAGS